jgi:antitoxin VapB
MPRTAQLFMNGRSQAVRLPKEFRFEGVKEVYVRRDPDSGDVILSKRPRTLAEFFEHINAHRLFKDFMKERPLNVPYNPRKIF